MGLGLKHGSPIHFLTRDWYATGDKLATWIEREIPSFVGNVPVEYTSALVTVLRTHHVPQDISRDAFSKLAQRGVRFDWPINELDFRMIGVAAPIGNRGGVPQAQMRAVTKGEAMQIQAYTFEEYERKYVLAIKTNDAAGAEEIIAAVLQLLWSLAKGYAKMKDAARKTKGVEWEEFNTAVNEALGRAMTLQTHVRYISREELTSLRESPTPTSMRNLTLRLATRVTTRTVPPARRVRR